MSSKRARRASSPHPVTPFVAAVPTTPIPLTVAQDTPVYERKTPRPRSIQATPDVRPRRSSLKPTASSRPVPEILNRLEHGDFTNAFSSPSPPELPQTPLPSHLNASKVAGGSQQRSNSDSDPPQGSNRVVDAAAGSPKRFVGTSDRRGTKPPPSPRQTSASRPRSKSKSRRELSDYQDFDTEISLASKLDSRLPVSIHEQNSFSEDSPSPRPSRSTASNRTPLKSSRRAMAETDSAAPAELRRYSPRAPVPYRDGLDNPRTPSLPSDPSTSPPRDLQKLGHFRVMNADESSDDGARSVPSRFSPVPLQTPPVEFQRRFPSVIPQLQGGRSPASELGQASPLHSRHRAPGTPSTLLKREELPDLRAATATDSRRPAERRERRKSHGTNDIRKAPPSVSSAPSPRTRLPQYDSPRSQPRTPQSSTRAFSGGTSASESLTPRSSRPPQSQTFPLSSPSSTATLLDTTPRHEAPPGKELGALTDKKSHRSRRNTEAKHIDASPRERGHALRGLFDKLGLGFAFDQTPQEIGLVDNFQSDLTLDSTKPASDTSEPHSWAMPTPPTDAQLDRQTALFTALSSASSRGRPEVEDDEFCEPARPSFDEDDERGFAQTYVVDDDDGNVFGLTAATSLNRISASPNPDTHPELADHQISGKHVGQSNSDDLYFSPEPTRPTPRHPVFNKPMVQDYAESDRQASRDPRDSNRKAFPRTLRQEKRESEEEESWAHGYDGMLPAPSLPMSSPSIVIQPSTSISSNDTVPRVASMDSVSQYSDNESFVEGTTRSHQPWSPNHPPQLEHSKAEVHGALRTLPAEGYENRSSANEWSIGSRRPDERFREASQSCPSADDGPTAKAQPTIDKPFAPTPKTWKSTLPADALRSLLEKYGAIEMRRQEVIWELCNTEQEFVESLRTVLRLFVQPLRTKDGKWIAGLPSDVTSLFDWLDDIIRLHAHISTALLDVRSAQYPIVLQVAEALRAFVPCFELHQPYLVRLEAASQLIAEMAQDRDSDLGEFIRIQTTSPECGGMPLSSFLLKPVQRLMKYPLFFKRLLELTPRNHPDYLATFSLMHSTDMVIKVMQEVKAREDEYDLVKNLTERIKGLPNGFILATRERRLIAQGLLRRAFPNEKERVQLESSPATLPGPTAPEPLKLTPSIPSQTRLPLNANVNKLFPITSPRFQLSFDPPNEHYSRPDSMASDFSTEPGFGDGTSDGTRSTTSSSGIVSPSTTVQSMRPDSIASSCASFDQDYMSRDPYAASPETTVPRRRSSLRSLKGKREVPIYAFVFTDLVLLTVPVSERNILRSPKSGESKDYWRVVDDVGISRVLGVKNLSGKLDHDHLLSIDLLPMTPGRDLDISSSPYAVPVYISLPERMTSRMALAPPNILEEARSKWFDAFDKCSRHTLRSLCFPPKPESDSPGSTAFSPLPKSRGSVFAMLALEAPLPCSPSQLAMDGERRAGGGESPERLQRQWWSARFQNVMREMERGEIPWMTSDVNSAMAVQPQQRRMADPKRASTMGGPRPLILGSKLSSSSATEERKSGLLRSLSRKGR